MSRAIYSYCIQMRENERIPFPHNQRFPFLLRLIFITDDSSLLLLGNGSICTIHIYNGNILDDNGSDFHNTFLLYSTTILFHDPVCLSSVLENESTCSCYKSEAFVCLIMETLVLNKTESPKQENIII